MPRLTVRTMFSFATTVAVLMTARCGWTQELPTAPAPLESSNGSASAAESGGDSKQPIVDYSQGAGAHGISGAWIEADKRGQDPIIVRPRYGSILTGGAYHPQMVPAPTGQPNGWQPGGETGRIGRPNYYSAPGNSAPLYEVHRMQGTPWGHDHSVYQYHFGPGFYRTGETGHYRFPYYTYRAPWYFPGHPIYNRFTNLAW